MWFFKRRNFKKTCKLETVESGQLLTVVLFTVFCIAHKCTQFPVSAF